jgi:hypothetical protein
MSRPCIIKPLFRALCVLLLAGSCVVSAAAAQQVTAVATSAQVTHTIETLNSLIALQASMRADIDKLHSQLEAAQSAQDKKEIQKQIDKMDADLQATSRNLKEIAAGADIDTLRVTEEKPFNFQEELFSLIRPALKEMKDMTSHVRAKSDLKERIAYYREKLPVTQRAVENITRLLENTDDAALQKILQGVLDDWKKQLTYIQGELQSAELQLTKLEQSEETLAQASQSYLKSFFQQRGLYLTQALLVVIVILVVSRLSYRAMVRLIPGYRAEHRSFRLRLLDLMHRILTTLLAILGPMVVFYVVEDWVLFSVGILILIGIGLTLRNALPRYWQQIQLFLNVGSVREGERIYLDGLPWLVKQINIFSILENPVAELCLRVRIDDLVDMKSHPYRKEDPWFPCKRGDWVLLSDGARGKLLGISPELVQMVMRGGATRTYQTADFLSLSPVNLSRNFRLKETIGISYGLQQDSVAGIPAQLFNHVESRIAEEGYGKQLLNLRVEFERANSSSLDLVVIADFDGALAELYGRLGRAMQRWCVEACTLHGWEIPFTQLTLHQAAAAGQETA